LAWLSTSFVSNTTSTFSPASFPARLPPLSSLLLLLLLLLLVLCFAAGGEKTLRKYAVAFRSDRSFA